MKKAIYTTALAGVLCLSLAAPSQAKTKMSISPEVSGIEKIFNLIYPVSLSQTEQKSNQSVLVDILDAKNQIYTQQKTTSSIRATVPTSVTTQARNLPTGRSVKSF